MSSHSGKEDVIGKWSEDKLQLLEKYLKAYSTIMNNQKQSWLKSYHYIDAFAGSGKPKAKSDEGQYIAGSPLRALQCEPQFDYYWFIELSSWRIERLRELQKQFSRLSINICEGDSNEILCNKIVRRITYASKQRGLVFLDPFGLQVDFETVKALAEVDAFDVFVNFPLMAITRLLKRDEPPKGQVKTLLDKVLGNTDWIQVIYKPSSQLSLFGNQTIERDVIRAEWLARLYSDQIGTLFRHVSNPVIMRNSKNSPLYALFLTSQNKNAVKIANEIFGKFEHLRKLDQ